MKKISRYRSAVRHYRNVVEFTWNHPANAGRRVRAVGRLMNFHVRGSLLRRPTLARIGDRSYIWAHIRRYATLKVVCANPPDHPEMLIWRRVLKPGELFLDVGANIGTYTIWAGDLGAHVIALEPAPDTYELLVKNVALNSHTAEVIRAAAGATCGVTGFTVGRDDVNRVDPCGKARARMVTIDSVLGERVAAGMKIDVEGFEVEVLRGCRQALAEHRIRLIQIEWNGTSTAAVGSDRQPIASLLAGFGYSLYRPDREGLLVPLTDVGFGPDIFARPQ